MPPLPQYKSWPGLANPQADIPIQPFLLRWTEQSSQKRIRRWLHGVCYRLWRWIAHSGQLIIDEVTEAPKRTFVEVLFGLPVVLLAVDPYRDWVKGLKYGWEAIAGFAVLSFLYGIHRRISDHGSAAERTAHATDLLQIVISGARTRQKEFQNGTPVSNEIMHQTMGIILQAIADLAAAVLQVPERNRIYANLMIPMPVVVEGMTDRQPGCGIVAYSLKRPPEPNWTRLVATDIGAAEALAKSKLRHLEDTKDPIWCGLFRGVRSRSFISFPVLKTDNKAIAVVNVDSTRPLTFSDENKEILHRALAGALDLLADILYVTREGAPIPAAPNSVRRRHGP